MKVPNAKPLLGYKGNLVYFLVGDEIFPLKTWLCDHIEQLYHLLKRYLTTVYLEQEALLKTPLVSWQPGRASFGNQLKPTLRMLRNTL